VGRLFGGSALLLLALFMLAGFLGSNSERSAAASFLAFAVAVVLPAGMGTALLIGHFRGKSKLSDRKAELRQKTIEAELLSLAQKHAGKLTIVESVSALAITPEDAKDALDALARRGLADFEVTDSGVIVYVFHDVQRLSEKSKSRGLLE